MMNKILLVAGLLALSLIVACGQQQAKPVEPMKKVIVCGNGVCESSETEANCPADCAAASIPAPVPVEDVAPVDCVGEGGTIPVIPNPPVCCEGLTLIDRKESSILGISGICTAKCGNGVCDSETESPKNCPADCEGALDSQPYCDGVGTSKEGWYQNDKILFYARCSGCTAECRNQGTSSEGWYNACNDKQIKRVCG